MTFFSHLRLGMKYFFTRDIRLLKMHELKHKEYADLGEVFFLNYIVVTHYYYYFLIKWLHSVALVIKLQIKFD